MFFLHGKLNTTKKKSELLYSKMEGSHTGTEQTLINW